MATRVLSESGLLAAGGNSVLSEGDFPGLSFDRGSAEAAATSNVLRPARSRGREGVRPASPDCVWSGRRVSDLGAGVLLLFRGRGQVKGTGAGWA